MNHVCLSAKLSQNSHQGYPAKNGGSYPCLDDFSPEIVLGWPEYKYEVASDRFVARYYDATIGRFISPDTIVPEPFNPQSLNRYSYCLNNPLRYVDPSGHLSMNPDIDPVTGINWGHDTATGVPTIQTGQLIRFVYPGTEYFVEFLVSPGNGIPYRFPPEEQWPEWDEAWVICTYSGFGYYAGSTISGNTIIDIATALDERYGDKLVMEVHSWWYKGRATYPETKYLNLITGVRENLDTTLLGTYDLGTISEHSGPSVMDRARNNWKNNWKRFENLVQDISEIVEQSPWIPSKNKIQNLISLFKEIQDEWSEAFPIE